MTPDDRPKPPGLAGENHPRQASKRGGQASPPMDPAHQRVYRGYWDPTAPGTETRVTVDGEPLTYRYDLLSASPSGFEWGYGGSGPAQLAIALLADAYTDGFATNHYQRFKREVVVHLPHDGWTLRETALDAWREGMDDA